MADPILPGLTGRRAPRETLAARAKEASPLLAVVGTIATAVTVAGLGFVQSCTAQEQAAAAAAQANVTQKGQVKADVELDSAYRDLADQVQLLGDSIATLTQSATEQGKRVELLETIVKAGLGNAARKLQPEESIAPDVDVKEVTAPLPASPAASVNNRRQKP